MIYMTAGRLNIGLLINGLEDDFANAICKGAAEYAKVSDVNLFVFPGQNFQMRLTTIGDTLFNSQYGTVFSYVPKDKLDAVIISAGSIFNKYDEQQALELIKQFSDIPTVTLCYESEGCGCVRYDASAGLSELIEHLIVDHNCRKIAFVAGAENNGDSQHRLQIYSDVLRKHSIEYREDLVEHGDFSTESTQCIVRLLDRFDNKIDAICCANDRIATDAYKAIEDRGLRVGHDIIVTGYDNVSLSLSLNPLLTTVNANPSNIGSTAVSLAMEMTRTHKPRTITLQSMPLIRESCGFHTGPIHSSTFSQNLAAARSKDDKSAVSVGMFNYFRDDILPFANLLIDQLSNSRIESINHDELISIFIDVIKSRASDILFAMSVYDFAKLMHASAESFCSSEKKRIQLTDLYNDIYQKTCSFLQAYACGQKQESRNYNLLISSLTFLVNSDQKACLSEIMQHLCRLNIQNGYLYLAEKSIPIADPSIAYAFDTLQLKAYHHGVNCIIPDEDLEFGRYDLLNNDYIDFSERVTLVTVPLFTINEQLGVAVFDLPVNFFDYVHLLSRQLSTALESIALFSRMISHIEYIEQRNHILATIASKDSLTGLYNRYGFFQYSESAARDPANNGRRAMVIFADMDNLKPTNDNFGHEEGDFALCLINDALQQCFGSNSIIGRIGGDEFAVLTFPEKNDTIESITERFKSILKELSDNSGKPYHVTSSIGVSILKCSVKTPIKDYIDIADKRLYQDKAAKPKSILKD